ncbi:hypothetical protein, partial [Photobacterium angustum]|uniref:hypothetical protein n=1 Tax=Photobacterium angustum TaxID=661 RepID=UPI001F2ACE00
MFYSQQILLDILLLYITYKSKDICINHLYSGIIMNNSTNKMRALVIEHQNITPNSFADRA